MRKYSGRLLHANACRLIVPVLLSCSGSAQPPAAAPLVHYSPARSHTLQNSLRLPGSLEPLRTSAVASTAAGLVTRLAVRDGQAVQAGDLLIQLDVSALELKRHSLLAQRRETETRLKLTRQKAGRAQELSKSGLISNQELEELVNESTAWDARFENLAAEMAVIDHEISRYVIRAPFAGTVLKKYAEVGQWMKLGDSVVDLMSTDQMEVTVQVPESRYSGVRVGSPARVFLPSLNGRELRGRVSAVIPSAEPEGRSFPVKVTIPGSPGIAAGMTAEVVFGEWAAAMATMVPKDAVVVQGDRKFLFVIEKGSTVGMRPVRTGSGDGEWIQVDSVRAGENVIVRGNERLKAGQPVKGQLVEYRLP